jgi:hypothetical protein
MKAPDFLAITLCLLSLGGGFMVVALSKRVAISIGVPLMAIGCAGLLFWFVYLRNIVETSTSAEGCTIVVGRDNNAPSTNNCPH